MKLEKKYYIFTASLTILSILMAIANTAQPLIVEQFINQLGFDHIIHFDGNSKYSTAVDRGTIY